MSDQLKEDIVDLGLEIKRALSELEAVLENLQMDFSYYQKLRDEYDQTTRNS